MTPALEFVLDHLLRRLVNSQKEVLDGCDLLDDIREIVIGKVLKEVDSISEEDDLISLVDHFPHGRGIFAPDLVGDRLVPAGLRVAMLYQPYAFGAVQQVKDALRFEPVVGDKLKQRLEQPQKSRLGVLYLIFDVVGVFIETPASIHAYHHIDVEASLSEPADIAENLVVLMIADGSIADEEGVSLEVALEQSDPQSPEVDCLGVHVFLIHALDNLRR